MVKSMTGFGRCEVSDAARKITVELKSVNHRFLDINIKMPKKLSFFEASMRALIKEYTERGKLDVFVTYDDYTDQNYSLKYNKNIAAAYYSYIKDMAEEFGLENDLTVSRLSRYPEVFSLEEQGVDDDELWKEIEKAFRGALKEFSEARLREGENLKNDLIGKLQEMSSHVGYIEERAPEIIEEYKNRLFDRVKELMADASVEENRILAEVTIFADKICVDEELVRLKSHIHTMK